MSDENVRKDGGIRPAAEAAEAEKVAREAREDADQAEIEAADEESASDGLSAGLMMVLIVGMVGMVAMAVVVFPGLLLLVPVAIIVAALIGMQALVYKMFGMKIRGPRA